jgi:hypothetical protein
MHYINCILIILLVAFNANANTNNISNLETLFINNSKKELIRFNVEIADTPEEQAKGLMYRTNMPDDQGMLFLFRKPKVINMWMKNTYIPLDILFINRNGVIKKIVKNATPGSLKTISSDVSVIAALEINAMMADSHFIRVNDVILHPFFNNIKDLNDSR